jgi:hypothetical protein
MTHSTAAFSKSFCQKAAGNLTRGFALAKYYIGFWRRSQ